MTGLKKLRTSKEIIDAVRSLSDEETIIQLLLYDKKGVLTEILECRDLLIKDRTKRIRRPRAILRHYIELVQQHRGYCSVLGLETKL
jgi:hypothetical protein